VQCTFTATVLNFQTIIAQCKRVRVITASATLADLDVQIHQPY